MIRLTLWFIAVCMLIFVGIQVVMIDLQDRPVQPPPCHKKVCLT